MTTILQAMRDPNLFGKAFVGPSWSSWEALLGALFGLPMSASQESRARACTGRQDALSGPYRESWWVIGRRAGKSRVLALVACYLAAFVNWRSRLASGETAVVMLLASDRSQASVLMDYCRALLTSNPMLAALVTAETNDRLELGSLAVAIEVHASSYRSVRGRTLAAAVLDETAFWRSETSANPAEEVVRALRPSLLTLAPHSVLIGASSPYARSGLLWDMFRRHHGVERSPVLLWQASSRTMNSTIPAELVAEAFAADPEAGGAEYLAEFRRDIAAFVPREVIDAAVVSGRFELPPSANTKYHAFCDPSGGSSDSFTLAIAHREGAKGCGVLDCIREYKPPFNPSVICQAISDVLRDYSLSRAVADKYAGTWVTSEFAKHGITITQNAVSKSDLYSALLPMLNSGRVELLDNPRLLAQLAGLERRTARSGRDSIDHPPNGHDDVINSAAGALTLALAKPLGKIDLNQIIFGKPSEALKMFIGMPSNLDFDPGPDDRYKWRD